MTIEYLAGNRLRGIDSDRTTQSTSSTGITWDTSIVQGISISGSTVTKTAGAGWGNNYVRSTNTFTVGSGLIEISLPAGDDGMVGFNKGTVGYHHAGTPLNQNDFGIYMAGGDPLEVYENGSKNHGSGGTRDNTEIYSIKINNSGLVTYWMNGVLTYTSSNTASGTYYVDVHIYSTSDAITPSKVTVTTVNDLNVSDGSIFYATDTNKSYILYSNSWSEL